MKAGKYCLGKIIWAAVYSPHQNTKTPSLREDWEKVATVTQLLRKEGELVGNTLAGKSKGTMAVQV